MSSHVCYDKPAYFEIDSFIKQVDRIVGVIDHHALQNATIVTDKPIYIDIRPWGSMSTSTSLIEI